MRILGVCLFVIGGIAFVFAGIAILIGVISFGLPGSSQFFFGGFVTLFAGLMLTRVSYIIRRYLDFPTEKQIRRTP